MESKKVVSIFITTLENVSIYMYTYFKNNIVLD